MFFQHARLDLALGYLFLCYNKTGAEPRPTGHDAGWGAKGAGSVWETLVTWSR